MEKLLTVVVPSYNVEKYLEETLESFVIPEIMDDLEVLSHCLLLDDVWVENNLIGAKMYTIFKLGISSQSTAFLL